MIGFILSVYYRAAFFSADEAEIVLRLARSFRNPLKNHNTSPQFTAMNGF